MKFFLDPKQQQQAQEWIDNQLKTKPHPEGAAGGRFTFSFTPTNLGVTETITDQCTKEVLDLTDYSGY